METSLFMRRYMFLLAWLTLSIIASMVPRGEPTGVWLNLPDSFENIFNSYQISAGRVAYRDFASNHFPGVFQFLGMYFEAFQLNKISPSPRLYEKSIIVATLGTASFQLLAVSFAFYILEISVFLGLFFGFVAMLVTSFFFGTHIPLTESYHVYLFISFPLILIKILTAETATERLKHAWWIFGPHFVLSVWLGLTTVLVSLLGFFVGFCGLCRDYSSISAFLRERPKLIAVEIFITILPLILMIVQTDLKGLYFYNFPFNAPLQSNLLTNVSDAWSQILGFENGFQISPLFVGVCLILLAGVNLNRQKFLSLRLNALYLVLMLSVVTLIYWRTSSGSKVLPIYGLVMGLGLWSVRGILAQIRIHGPMCPLKKVSKRFFLMVSLIFFVAFYAVNRKIYPLKDSGRSSVFDQARICQFKDPLILCKCLRLSNWDPMFFLSSDVRPCQGWSVFNVLVTINETTRKQLENDANDPGSAFILAKPLNAFGFPDYLGEQIEKNKTCRPMNGDFNRLLCS